MNVPYTDMNLKEAAKRIGVCYSALSRWCKEGLVNCTNIGGGTKNARYALTDKEIEHLVEERRKHGKRFIVNYNKNWDVPEEVYEEYEEPCDSEVEDIPTRKSFDLDGITTTISYMQDIKDRLSFLEREKKPLLEKLDDIEAEMNQLTNEYAELKTEVLGVL